jgi:hypothetical protein
VKAYKFLKADGVGPFSGFLWPLPNGGPGPWVEAESVAPCRAGVHACRARDLPFWVGAELYEVELGGDVAAQELKLVAPRARLVRRIDAWAEGVRDEYSRFCIARANQLAAESRVPVDKWAPDEAAAAMGPALMGFIAARIAEESGGVEAYYAERARQVEWLVERLGLE